MSNLEKIAEILTVAKQPALKQHIMSKCSLSSKGFNKYINLLLENGLVHTYPTIGFKHLSGRPTKRRMWYQTNVKGMLFLKRYAELTMLLKSEQLTYPNSPFLHTSTHNKP